MRLRFTSKAWSDLEAISDWISQHNLDAADRLVERILSSLRTLEFFPDMGRPTRNGGIREWVVPGLAYVAIYRVDRGNEEVVVIALLHTSRNRY